MKFHCFIFFSIIFQPFLSALKYSSEVIFFPWWLCNIPVGLILLLAVSGCGLFPTILSLQIKFQLYYSYYHMKNPTINDKMKEYVLITSLISA